MMSLCNTLVQYIVRQAAWVCVAAKWGGLWGAYPPIRGPAWQAHLNLGQPRNEGRRDWCNQQAVWVVWLQNG